MGPILQEILSVEYYASQRRSFLFLIWTLKLISITPHLPGSDAAAVISSNLNSIKSDDYLYQQIPAPRPLLSASPELDNNSVMNICSGCKLGENGKMCSGHDQGECDCENGNVICRCKAEWTGDACQYLKSKINCEKMRSCILCQVYGAGPLAEGKDCEYFCHRNYPTPLIVKTLHFQEDEHLCSFIHHVEDDATTSRGKSEQCRYFFKFGPVLYDGSIDSSNLYIVAQQDMDCGKPAKYPTLKPIANNNNNNNDTFRIIAKTYDEVARTSDIKDPGQANRPKSNFFALVVIFVFIALPFVTCAFSLIYNFSNLPCGLCNKFRQSSSKYIRNVRPFPGFLPSEEASSMYFRNDDRISDAGRASESSEGG